MSCKVLKAMLNLTFDIFKQLTHKMMARKQQISKKKSDFFITKGFVKSEFLFANSSSARMYFFNLRC
jgi:hypothetical protein